MPIPPTAGMTRAALGVVLSLHLGACATANEPTPATVVTADGLEVIEKSGGEQQIDAVIRSVDQKTGDANDPVAQEVGDEITNARSGAIPLELNDDVERWIEYFTVRDRERFQRFMERGEKYRPMITAVLRDQGIPTEIYYQAMIESGFQTSATSHASAVGVWQFIKPTAQRYGLRVDAYVDERRDPMRATIAAALYMKDLHNVFQSWYLAMAAYNAGESRIMGAIMRAKTRDFWEMVRGRALPAETLNYIPKFLAATIIGHNARRYGFEELSPEVMPVLTSVTVPSSVRLEDIARVTGVDLATIKESNPNILRGVTPPGDATYRLWIPKDEADRFAGQADRLAALRVKGLSLKSAERSTSDRVHTVARGESLTGIATKYGMTIAQLKRLNELKSTKVAAGTRLKVAKAEASPKAGPRSYKVRAGDNLDVIAKRFGLSIDELKRLNRLKRNTIFVGQLLKVQARRI